MRSKHVAREVYFAEEAQIPILPIRIDDAGLTGSLKYLLGLSHYLDIGKQDLSEKADMVLAALRQSSGPKETISKPSIVSAESLRGACHQILKKYPGEVYFHLSIKSVPGVADACLLKPDIIDGEDLLHRMDKQLEETSFVFLVGDAGSGKSITLREIERVTARNLLDRLSDSHSMSHLSKQGARLPITIDLTRMDFTMPDCVSLLESQLFLSISRMGFESGAESQARRHMRFLCDSAGLLLLVDGINQIAPGNRDRCIRALQEIRATYRAIRVIVAARPHSFLAPAGLRSVEISPLAGQQASIFLIQHGLSEERADDLLEALAESGPSLAWAATNPFFLMLACEQVTYVGDTPKHLAELLDAFVERRLVDVARDGPEALLLRRCLHTVANSIPNPGGSLRHDAIVDVLSNRLSDNSLDARQVLTILERAGLMESADHYAAFWHQNVHEFLIADDAAYRCTEGLPPEGRLTLTEGSPGERELQRLFQAFIKEGEPWDIIVRFFAERADARSQISAARVLRNKNPRLAALVFRSIANSASPEAGQLLATFQATANKYLLKAERAYGHWIRRALLWAAYIFGFLIIFIPPEEIEGSYTIVSGVLLFVFLFVWDILNLVLIFTVPLLLVLLGVRTLQRRSRDRVAETQISVLHILGDEDSIKLHSAWYDKAHRGDLRSRTLRGLLLTLPPACEPFDEATACELLLKGKGRLYQLSMLANRGTKVCLESISYAMRVGDRSVGFLLAVLATLVRIQRRNPETRAFVADILCEAAEGEDSPSLLRIWAARILESWEVITKRERKKFEHRAGRQIFQNLLKLIFFCMVTWFYAYLLDSFITNILLKDADYRNLYDSFIFSFAILLWAGSWMRNKVASLPRPFGYLSLLPDLYFLQFRPLYRIKRAVLGRWRGFVDFGRDLDSLWALLRDEPEKCEQIACESRDHGFVSEPSVLANAGVAWLRRGDEEKAGYWLNLAMENVISHWGFRHAVERYLELLPRLKIVRDEDAARFKKVRDEIREEFQLMTSSQASGWANRTLKQEQKRSRKKKSAMSKLK
jgi:hypothetical protein